MEFSLELADFNRYTILKLILTVALGYFMYMMDQASKSQKKDDAGLSMIARIVFLLVPAAMWAVWFF